MSHLRGRTGESILCLNLRIAIPSLGRQPLEPSCVSITGKNPILECRMKLNCKFDRRGFLKSSAVFTSALWLPKARQHASEGSEITLATWPHHVYKENDGVLQPGLTESCVFNLMVRDTQNRVMGPISAHWNSISRQKKFTRSTSRTRRWRQSAADQSPKEAMGTAKKKSSICATTSPSR